MVDGFKNGVALSHGFGVCFQLGCCASVGQEAFKCLVSYWWGASLTIDTDTALHLLSFLHLETKKEWRKYNESFSPIQQHPTRFPLLLSAGEGGKTLVTNQRTNDEKSEGLCSLSFLPLAVLYYVFHRAKRHSSNSGCIEDALTVVENDASVGGVGATSETNARGAGGEYRARISSSSLFISA